jgi:hypothetical protein
MIIRDSGREEREEIFQWVQCYDLMGVIIFDILFKRKVNLVNNDALYN